jgi:hypothetical protein
MALAYGSGCLSNLDDELLCHDKNINGLARGDNIDIHLKLTSATFDQA